MNVGLRLRPSRLMVIIAWIAGKPLLLLFDPFESVVRTDNFYSKIERELINGHFQTLFLSVLAVNYVVADGKVRIFPYFSP